MIKLPPTARLALALIRLKPGLTFQQLFSATECSDTRTVKDALRNLVLAGLVTESDAKPATYTATERTNV